MADQTYALAKSGVFGLKNGSYQDALATLIDSAEDGDIAEYGGDTGSFGTTTSIAYDGSYAIEATSGSSAIHDTDISLTTGSTYEFRQYQTSTSSDGGWCWMSQSEVGRSSQSCYVATIRSNNDDMLIIRRDSGDQTNLASTAITVPVSEWLRGEVNHKDDGSITFAVYDASGSQLGSVSTTDTTYTAGGHGFSCYNPAAWDYIREV